MERDAAGAETRVVTIEPAHEALLRQWGLLEGWLSGGFRAAGDNGRWARGTGRRTPAPTPGSPMGASGSPRRRRSTRADIAAKLDTTDRAYLAACRAKEEATRAEVEARRREREEEARRLADARRLTAVIGIALVAALALAAACFGRRDATAQRIAAQRAEQDAKRQSERATHALTLATNTANGLVFDLAQKFRDIAGVPASLVKDILDRVLVLQGQLLAAGESSPELRQSQAAALDEASRTLLTIGDTKGALAGCHESDENFWIDASAGSNSDDEASPARTLRSLQQGRRRPSRAGDLPAALNSYSGQPRHSRPPRQGRS